jgi:hypothetical protein|nr:MAG TPA: DNA-binding protein [Crassvirales sp.]
MNNKDIVKEVSNELGISYDIVLKVFKSYWSYLKEKIMLFDAPADITETEFKNTKHSINIKYIGKLSILHSKYTNAKNKKAKMSVQSDTCNK